MVMMASSRPRRRIASALTFVCALLAASCTSEGASSPSSTASPSSTVAPSPTVTLGDLAGRIVVHTDDGSLVVIEPDGANPIVVADGTQGRHSQPTWSPDAASIAWASFDAEGPNVTVHRLDSEPNLIAPLGTPPFYLYWAPTSASIAMLRPVAGSIEQSLLTIETGDVEPLGVGQPFYFVWEESGDALIAAVNGESLIRVLVDGEIAYESLQGNFPLAQFQTPAVLASDNIVVPVEQPDGTVIAQGPPGNLTPLATITEPVSLGLSPNGQRLAVLPFQTGTAPESPMVEVVFQGSEVALPSGRVSIIDLDSGAIQTLADTDVLTMNWSPDSSTVAALRRLDEGLLEWVFHGDTVRRSSAFAPTARFIQNYLAFADQYNHSSTWWSPDSQAFVWTAIDGEDNQVWVDVLSDDAPATVVAEGDVAFWSPG